MKTSSVVFISALVATFAGMVFLEHLSKESLAAEEFHPAVFYKLGQDIHIREFRSKTNPTVLCVTVYYARSISCVRTN